LLLKCDLRQKAQVEVPWTNNIYFNKYVNCKVTCMSGAHRHMYSLNSV
jgi:hypothetical protein